MCSGCLVQSTPGKTYYIGEGIAGGKSSIDVPKYGSLENPAVSCFDLSMETEIKPSILISLYINSELILSVE